MECRHGFAECGHQHKLHPDSSLLEEVPQNHVSLLRCDSVGIMVRQNLSNSSLPNLHVHMISLEKWNPPCSPVSIARSRIISGNGEQGFRNSQVFSVKIYFQASHESFILRKKPAIQYGDSISGTGLEKD